MKRMILLVILLALLTLVANAAQAAPARITWYGHAAFKVVTPNGKVLLATAVGNVAGALGLALGVMPLAGVEALVAFLADFARRKG